MGMWEEGKSASQNIRFSRDIKDLLTLLSHLTDEENDVQTGLCCRPGANRA